VTAKCRSRNCPGFAIPASSDTVEFAGRRMKQCLNVVHKKEKFQKTPLKKNSKKSPFIIERRGSSRRRWTRCRTTSTAWRASGASSRTRSSRCPRRSSFRGSPSHTASQTVSLHITKGQADVQEGAHSGAHQVTQHLRR
jgi:hypothetical protein